MQGLSLRGKEGRHAICGCIRYCSLRNCTWPDYDLTCILAKSDLPSMMCLHAHGQQAVKHGNIQTSTTPSHTHARMQLQRQVELSPRPPF